jgi:hypothetical protein
MTEPFSGELLHGLERRDGGGGVGAVDEGDVDEPSERPDDRVALELLLRDAGEIALDESGDDERVEVVAMAEDEHGRPLGPEVVAAGDVEVDAVEPEHEVEPPRGGDVHDLELVSLDQRAHHTGGTDRHDRRRAGQGSDRGTEASVAPTAEADDRPPPTVRDRGELGSRVDRTRVADEVHEREVLVAVCVEVAAGEIDVPVSRELLHGVRLARSPQDGRVHVAREHAVLHGEPVAQHMVDAEEASNGFHLVARCRRRQHHGVYPALV